MRAKSEDEPKKTTVGAAQNPSFARDIKRMKKRGKEIIKLQAVVEKLAQEKTLPPKNNVA